MRIWVVVAAFAAGGALAGHAAAGQTVLAPIEPAAMEPAVLQRGAARATAAGLKEVETFAGASFTVRDGGRVLGAIVSGRATDARMDGHEKTCFAVFVRAGPGQPELLLLSGRWPWAQADCHGVKGVGALPGPGVRIGVVYDGATARGTETEPVVLSWGAGQAPAVDFTATRRAMEAGAEDLAAMARAVR